MSFREALRNISLYSTLTCGLPKRLIMICLLHTGLLTLFSMRANLDWTIVNLLTKLQVQPLFANSTPSLRSDNVSITGPDLDWDAKMVSMLRSLYYLGFLLTQVLGSYLSTRMPASGILGLSIFASSLLNLTYPTTLAKGEYISTCLIRFLQGLLEGLVYPSVFRLMWHWIPKSERNRSGGMVLSGAYLGSMLGYIITVAASDSIGWQMSYYMCSGFTMLWVAFWVILAYERPESHPYICEKEMTLLENRSKHTISINEQIPWLEMIFSRHVAVLFLCSFSFSLLYTNEPSYVTVYGFGNSRIGFVGVLPNLCIGLIIIIAGFVCDLLMKDPILSETAVRKIFTCLGFGVEAFCFLCLTFLNNGEIALIYLTIGIGFSGFSIIGWQMNHLDLAPRYACILIGFSNVFGTLASLISPIAAGYLVPKQSLGQWQLAFGLFALCVTLAAICYGILASGDIQPWGEWQGHTDGEQLLQKLENDVDNKLYSPYITLPNFLRTQTPKNYAASDWTILNESDSEDELYRMDGSTRLSFESFDSDF